MHFKCIDMCLSIFKSLVSSPEPYYCHHCLTVEILFSDFTNEELQNLFNHAYNDKNNTLALTFDKKIDTPN